MATAYSRRARHPEYLAWIKTQPCSVPECLQWTGRMRGCAVEAHHAGTRGLSQKADDLTAIPLCGWHHRIGPSAVHVLGKNFWSFHRINRDKLIRELNLKFQREYLRT